MPIRSTDRSSTHAPRRTGETAAAAASSTTLQVSQKPTAELPGHLPKVEKVDVEKLSKKHDGLRGIQGVKLVAEVKLGVASPSGLCHLPTGETLIVDDDKGISVMKPGKKAERLVKDAHDTEGITVDDKGKHVWAVQESDRRVVRFDVKRNAKGEVRLEESGEARRLPKLKDVENKGWEGIAFLSGKLAGTKEDHLVCVHEGSPRRIGIYALPDLDEGVTLKLPKGAKELLPDLADVTIDPVTGHLLVVSDESQQIVELAIQRDTKAAPGALLERVELAVVSSFELPVKRASKPEGLAFDEQGRLWVSLDGDGGALVLELDR